MEYIHFIRMSSLLLYIVYYYCRYISATWATIVNVAVRTLTVESYNCCCTCTLSQNRNCRCTLIAVGHQVKVSNWAVVFDYFLNNFSLCPSKINNFSLFTSFILLYTDLILQMHVKCKLLCFMSKELTVLK